MTVKEIIIKYLKENNYDGLCCRGCGCSVDDLFPCGESFADCIPAKKRICDECSDNGHCEIQDDFDCSFCYHE